MNIASRRIVLAILCAWLGLALVQAASATSVREVLVLSAKGPLTPAMVEYLERGLNTAERREAEAVVLQLNTPGGAIDLMEKMVGFIRASQVPVVVYVAPRGAIAGSAGTVITLAGHVAAMAPETAIGAASPVGGQGEELGETLSAKVREILKAEVRALTSDRPPEAVALAESTIDHARAASADEALAVGLVDVIAKDVPDLLQQLDGRQVRIGGETRTLATADAAPVELPMNALEELLHVLTNPNVVFLLLAVGAQAIMIELSSPGGWVAGFLGVVCLGLAFYGLGVLPVNWFGLVLIATAFVLFVLEVNAPTHGALAITGVISFVVGALILFNSRGDSQLYRVSVPLVVATSLISAGLVFVVVAFGLRAQRRPVSSGVEALIGQSGEVREALDPHGLVHVAGELWTAESETGQPIEVGQSVEVAQVRGLRLIVREKKV